MIVISYVVNPLEDLPPEVFRVSSRSTVWDAVAMVCGKDEFTDPTIAFLNGEILKRSDWGNQLSEDDTLVFKGVIGGVEGLIVGLIVAAVSVGVSLALAPKPPDIPKVVKPPAKAQTFAPAYASASSVVEPDPVFELTGQRNKTRLGHTVEVSFGQIRLWPSYGAVPYNQFSGDDQQAQYSLFCLGVGEFEVTSVNIEDTPIENYDDVTYEIYQPGEEVTLFPDNIFTNTEVANIEMFGPNEPEYTGDLGPFVACPATTQTTEIQIDVVIPGGLNNQLEEGGLGTSSVKAIWEYREVDDFGDPTPGADWVTLGSFSKTLSTVDTKRYTLYFPVAEGRYEVRGRRTNNKDQNYRASNTIQWSQMRAFLPSRKVYEGVTMLAVAATASNLLNDNSSNRVNVYASRKIPVYDIDTQTWSEPVVNRSPMWAAAEVLRAQYGGNVMDACIDLDNFSELADDFDSEGLTFDWTFEQRTTVWEVLKTIGRSVRSVPYVRGSQISFFRDVPQPYAKSMFTPENTVKDSVSSDVWLISDDDSDGIEVEYIDPTTWQKETVLCLLPGDAGNNTDKLSLSGVNDRDRAYREGMYLRSVDVLARRSLRLNTGSEGNTLEFGDRFKFAGKIGWGNHGYVVRQVSDDVVVLSEELDFSQGDLVLSIRDKFGGVMGNVPITSIPGDPNAVRLGEAVDWSNTTLGSSGEPPSFISGVVGEEREDYRMVSITPSNSGNVKVVSVNYTEEVFAYDQAEAPPIGGDFTAPPIPDLPVVTGVTVSPISGTLREVEVTWDATFGAQSYVVEYSYDPVEDGWEFHERTSSVRSTLPITPGMIYVRVAAVNTSIGGFMEWSGSVGQATSLPLPPNSISLASDFTGRSMDVLWEESLTAEEYLVEVYDGATLERSEVTLNTSYSYTIEKATTDGASSREFTIRVTSRNSFGDSDSYVSVTADNPIPAEITSGVSYSVLRTTDTERTYRVSCPPLPDSDILSYTFWGESTQGFTPSPSNLVVDGSSQVLDISVFLDGLGDHPAYYWRVAAKDVWGDDVTPSAEQTIPAYTS